MATAKMRKARVTLTFSPLVLARARLVCKRLGLRLAPLVCLSVESRVRRLERAHGIRWRGQVVRLRAGRPRSA